MRKWIIMILSAILRPLLGYHATHMNPVQEVKDYITENALKAFVGIIMAIAIGTMFTAGLVMTIYNVTANIEAGNGFTFGAVSMGGLVIFLLAVAVIGTMLYFSRHDRAGKHHEMAAASGPSELETTIIKIVDDFLREQEIKKAKKKARQQERDRMAAASEMSSSFGERTDGPFDRH